MELAVLAHGEQASERTLGHFHDGFLDGDEFVLDVRVVPRFLIERLENLQRLFIPALHDEPSGGLGQVRDGGENNDSEDNLESQREAPGHLRVRDESKS